jgi:hypothetical protein
LSLRSSSLLVRVKELSTPLQCLQTAYHLELEKFLPPGEGHPHLLEVAGLLLQAGLPLPLLYRKPTKLQIFYNCVANQALTKMPLGILYQTLTNFY